jgi:hypothetical protein
MRIWFSEIFVLVLACAGCSDTVTSEHATLAAAKQDIERGWIPSVLPSSTVQIRESHDLDLNVGHGTFAFGDRDAEQFRAALRPLGPEQVLRAYRVSRADFERRGYRFYRHGDFDIAVDWKSQVGEFWLVSLR